MPSEFNSCVSKPIRELERGTFQHQCVYLTALSKAAVGISLSDEESFSFLACQLRWAFCAYKSCHKDLGGVNLPQWSQKFRFPAPLQPFPHHPKENRKSFKIHRGQAAIHLFKDLRAGGIWHLLFMGGNPKQNQLLRSLANIPMFNCCVTVPPVFTKFSTFLLSWADQIKEGASIRFPFQLRGS